MLVSWIPESHYANTADVLYEATDSYIFPVAVICNLHQKRIPTGELAALI